jgi:predicted PurR-regulated permease PerM
MPRRPLRESHSGENLQRLLILGLSGPIAALNVWLISQVFRYFEHLVTVLTVAAIVAFLLNYPVKIFEQMRIRRTNAVILVLLATVALMVILGVTLVPSLVNQTTQLLEKIPDWLKTSQTHLEALDVWAKTRNLPLDLKSFSGRLSSQIENQLQDVAAQALSVALGTVSGFVDGILIIVMAFYMLLYGSRLWQGVIRLLPPHIGRPFSRSLQLNFHNFFLSQFLLALFMVIGLIPILLWLRVPFALLFALLIGIAELIPFIGAALGIGVVTILVMFQNFWLAVWVAIAATILQQIRDNLIAPKLLGDFTGLNPIWIFIALLMGLQIGGLLGVFIAVPVAGTIKGTIDALQEVDPAPIRS